MAEGDGVVYNNFKEQVMEGEYAFLTDTLKMALLTGHAVDIDLDVGFADVSGDEEAGAGYTAGGATLAGKAVEQDNANDRGTFDATDVTWTGLDVGTPSHAVLYDFTHASDLLIAIWEVTTASNGGDYTLEFGAVGLLTIT